MPPDRGRAETWLLRICSHVLEQQLPRQPEVSFDILDETLRSEATRTDVVRSLTDPQRDFMLWELKQGCMTAVINCLSPLPDVPTTAEAGMPGLESSAWFGVLGPRGTPKPVVAKLNAEMNRLLAEPAFRKRLADIGVEPLGGTPEQFAKFLDDEIKKWGAVVRVSRAKID